MPPVHPKPPYASGYFDSLTEGSSRSASVVVPRLLSLLAVRSVIDVGCGIGAWLRAFLANGVPEVLGVDGEYVDVSQLLISPNQYMPRDLRQPLQVNRAFDLAMCLEVAEHLPKARAKGLVEDLVALAPCVVFSAAIPGQGGTEHINEQYLPYWIGLFRQCGYEGLDAIRPYILGNDSVAPWYQQNMVLFAAPGHPILAKGFNRPVEIIHEYLIDPLIRKPHLGRLAQRLPVAVHRSAEALTGLLGRKLGSRKDGR
jgi:SAM-dependent methyltransferase